MTAPFTLFHHDIAGKLGIILFLPTAREFAAGDFNLDDVIERLATALLDESQWNEILGLTGDTAILVIECLDKVSKIRSYSPPRILITL